MVQRCSNGAPFVVLEPEPAVRTGILVEIYDGANPATLLDVLPDTFARQWVDELKGVGSGRFKVSARNPKLAANPDLLAYGNLARFKLDNVTRFTMLIEHRTHTVAAEGEDGDRIIEVSGRGALAVLEDALVYATGGLTGEVERLFTTTAGAAMATLVGEAKARGTLGAVTLGFTGSVDSNNAPYALPVELTERAGTDLLRVAERHAEVAVDVWMTPSLELRYANTRGVDRTIQTVDTGPVVLRLASNVAALTVDEDGAIRNTLLIETPGGLLERVEGASVSQWRRREAFLSLGNTTASDQIDRSAEAVFRRSAQPAPDVTLQVDDVDAARPYVDFGLGDWVYAPDETGDLVRVRVRGLTVQDGPNGQPQFIPEVASVTAELEARLERWLAAMARGTVGGTAAEVAEPNKAPAEVVEAIDSGVADHLADTPHVDELSDLADVDVTGLSGDDALRYDAGAGQWVPVNRTLDELITDVNAPAPTDDQVLAWDDTAGEWRPVTPAGGGGGGGDGAPVYPFSGVDAEPASPDAMDDHFEGPSLDPKWTTLNIGSAAQVFEHSTLGFEVNENVNQWRGIYQPTPSGDWTVRAKILPAGFYIATTYLGLFAAASTTGEVRTIVLGNSTFVWGTSYTAPTSSASSWGTQRTVYPSAMYFEMEWDDSAGTLYTRASRTGLDKTFDLHNSVSLGYTPAIVGLGFANRAGQLLRFPFDWFRRVA